MTSPPAGNANERRPTRVIATARRRVNVDIELLTHALVLMAEELAQGTTHRVN